LWLSHAGNAWKSHGMKGAKERGIVRKQI
jgi:hypothetical protein